MNVIHVYDGHERVFLGEGSVPSVVYGLAKHMAEKGHDVTVLERRWEGTSYREEIEGIKFERFDLSVCSSVSNAEVVYEQIRKPIGVLRLIADRILFAVKANRYIFTNNFDVIHVHLPFSANVLINLNRKLGRKMVYTAHVGEEKKRFKLGPIEETPLPLRFSPDLYLMKRIRKSVVLNEPLRKKLIEKGIEEEKIVAIPNGIETRDFSNNADNGIKRKYGIEGRVIVMFAGTVTPRKGVYHLVKAAELLKDYKNTLFLLVGNTKIDRDSSQRLMKYIEDNDLENVKFTGFVPYEDLKELYSTCDIFVLPSLEEGFSVVITEALASGKPLIGTKVGGIPLQVKDGWNGFLIEPANEKQLAEKIRDLIDNPEKRKEMGKNSRKLSEEFDWNKIVDRYLQVYEEVKG